MCRTVVLASIIALLVALSAVAQEKSIDSSATVHREMFDPGRDAAKDIQLAALEAARSGRRILLDVGGEWCIWCKRLDAFFGDHPQVSAQLHRNFVVVKVNYSKENKNETVLSRFPKIPGYPHLFVLDADAKLLHSQDTGLLEEGKGYSEEKVTAFLDAWSPKHEAQ